MFNPNLLQRVIHKMKVVLRPIIAPIKKKCLVKTDFTIISNNCWGGVCYEAYGLPKNSPTIGGYFFADDYIKFVNNLKYYTSIEMQIISATSSKHYQRLKEQDNLDKWVGVLDDIEFIIVHYKDANEAKEKWMRRVKRINWDNLIFKFSMQNYCTEEELKKFDESKLPGKKFIFVNKKNLPYKCGIYYKGFEEETQVYNDTFYWNKYLKVTKFLND